MFNLIYSISTSLGRFAYFVEAFMGETSESSFPQLLSVLCTPMKLCGCKALELSHARLIQAWPMLLRCVALGGAFSVLRFRHHCLPEGDWEGAVSAQSLGIGVALGEYTMALSLLLLLLWSPRVAILILISLWTIL